VTSPRRGRRPGQSTTRPEILEGARALFGKYGYERTTLRMVAETVKVDPALVARAFGDKYGLFRAAVQWPWDPATVVPAVAAGSQRRAGYRIAKLLVDTWEDPDQRAPILALLTSTASNEISRTLLREFVTMHVLVPLVRASGFDQPELRGSLLAAQNIGLCMARYVVGIEPLASIEPTPLIELIGDTTQRLLTARLPDEITSA
jgi:AcrR family transcriptional regulator